MAVVVTTGDPERLAEMAAVCVEWAARGAAVTVFFRDESIPAVCQAAEAARLSGGASRGPSHVAELLQDLAARERVHLYACSSSLYIWGVGKEALLPGITARGLVAFLADDLAGASEVLSY